MAFCERFREYREYELNIKQIEAAYMLGLPKNTYSNYERGDRPFPIDMLPHIKETFNIPDDVFLDMVLDRKRPIVEKKAPMQTNDLRSMYLLNFDVKHQQLIHESDELRQLLSFVGMLDVKNRRAVLNAMKTLLSLNYEIIAKYEK